jgi:hypothetical protein
MKNLSQDSRSLGRDFNPGPPKYVAGMLTTRPQHLVNRIFIPRSIDLAILAMAFRVGMLIW